MSTNKAVVSVVEMAFEGEPVRAGMFNGQPVWVAKDACAALEIKAYRDAIAQLDADERVSISVDTLGGKQKVVAVTEGIYGLLLIAPAERAKLFRRFLKHTVLPALRRGEVVQIKAKEDWKKLRHEAAASHKLMTSSYRDVRAEADKTTEPHHYMSESKLVNWACFGEFRGYDRNSMDIASLDLLAAVEMQNAKLILRGYPYPQRKPILARYAQEERTKLTAKITGAN